MARLKPSSFLTRAEFLAAIDDIVRLQTKLRRVTAVRDDEIQRVQTRHQTEIDGLTGDLELLLAKAERYADEHRGEIFPGKLKTAATELAEYGFRQSPPALKTLNRKWTWEAVLTAVKEQFGKRFVRTEEALQKDALKAQLTAEQLAAVGLRIEQPETFGVTPKVEGGETEAIPATAAA